MKRTRLTSWLAIMLSAAMVLSTVGCGGSGSNSGGSTTAAGGTQATETTQAPAGTQSADATQEAGATEGRKPYESPFAAHGTDPETYNKNIAAIIQEMMDYFSETGELNTKLAGYDEPITMTTALSYTPAGVDDIGVYTDLYGETLTDNRWNDLYKQIFNIDVQYDWTAASTDYSETLRLEMSAGELPDVFTVYSQDDLRSLVEADQIWDLTDVYNEYASDQLRAKYAEDENGSLAYASVNGRLYGLPSANSTTDHVSYLYIRDDWMKKLNLEYPKNLEELKDVMKAFMTQDPDGNGKDDTWGLGLTKNLFFYTRGMAAGFGAYPEYWIEEDGNVVYGGTTEEAKQFVAFLADLYKEGYIDPEFVAFNDKELIEQIASEKVGIAYGSHGFPANNTGSLHQTNPDAHWKAVQIPYVTGEPVKSVIAPSVPSYQCVSKKYEHPEVAVKIVDFNTWAGVGGCSLGSWLNYGQTITQPFTYRGTGVYPVGAWSNLAAYRYIMAAYASDDYVEGDPNSVLDTVFKDADAKSKAYWNMQFNVDETFRWAQVSIYGPGEDTPIYVLEKAYEDGNLFMTPFFAVSNQTMDDNWSTIQDQELQIFTNIVIGNVSVEDGFQQWLDVFKSLKGDEITAFANEQAVELDELKKSFVK